VFYDFGIQFKLIIKWVKILPKITFFIKGHFILTSSLLLENVRLTKLRPENSDPLKIKILKTENHNLKRFQLLTGINFVILFFIIIFVKIFIRLIFILFNLMYL
jgi:hypothetical protein